MAALSRDELIKILSEVVHAARSRLMEARTGDALKAAEMLAKMCGYNERETRNVQHTHLHVDSALADQLRAGYSQIASVKRVEALGVTTPAGVASGSTPQTTIVQKHPMPALLDGTQNNIPPAP